MGTDSVTILCLMPEITLVTAAALVFVGGAFVPRGWLWNAVGLLACLVSGFLLAGVYFALGLGYLLQAAESQTIGPLVIDFSGYVLRWLSLLCGGLFVLATRQEDGGGERCGALLLVTSGTMLVAMAGDLVLLFLALELISIPTYMLLYLGRCEAATGEATAKYFYLSIFSSAVLLYGFTLLYGLSGSTSLAAVQASIEQAARFEPAGPASLMLPLALILVLAGLGYKIAAVPFHYYAPDVYQGVTCLSAGVLAVMPKIAGVVALVRLLGAVMPYLTPFAWQAALLLSVLSMTLGNVCALWQNNVRRLLAYSSIAHAGYILLGLTAGLALASGADAGGGTGSGQGVSALLLYLGVYAIASLGIFAALAHLGSAEEELNTVDQLAGLGRTRPMIAVALALMLFSLAGIPPLAGFWGKFEIFYSALVPLRDGLGQDSLSSAGHWLLVLAVVGVLNAAVAAAYYLRVIGAMYFRSPVCHVKAEGGVGAAVAALLCAGAVLVLGVLPWPMLGLASSVEGSLAGSVRQESPREEIASRAAPGQPLVSLREGSATMP